MTKMRVSVPVLLATAALPAMLGGQIAPDTVVVESGRLRLRALLWTPSGSGPFPAVLFNHGSYGRRDTLDPAEPAALGPAFARHGYVLLFPLRPGVGLSAGQGTSEGDRMAEALAARGQEGRNQVQLELLQGAALSQALAALALLRALPQVDGHRVAVAGHSFGGSLTLLLAARDASLRAVVVFAGATPSWDRSPQLRTRLRAAVRRTPPVFFIHAANDYSTAPGKALAAEMGRLGRPRRLTIYPAFGRTGREGHNLVYRSVPTWESDVFAFLDERLRR